MAPNGRRLPPPGADAGRVFLGKASDDPRRNYMLLKPEWKPFYWRQYYVPALGRSIWVKAESHPGKE